MSAGVSPYRSGGLEAERDREKICTRCGNRVTVGTDGQIEYGHARGESCRKINYLRRLES